MKGYMKQLFVIAMMTTVLCSCSLATVEPTSTLTVTETPTIMPTIELPTLTATPTSVMTLSECPQIGGGGNSWERYKPDTLENIVTEVSQISSSQKDPNIDSYYLEVGSNYQFPSCVTLEYSGTFREIPEGENF